MFTECEKNMNQCLKIMDEWIKIHKYNKHLRDLNKVFKWYEDYYRKPKLTNKTKMDLLMI